MKVGGDPGVGITGLCEQLGVGGEESCAYPEPLSCPSSPQNQMDFRWTRKTIVPMLDSVGCKTCHKALRFGEEEQLCCPN